MLLMHSLVAATLGVALLATTFGCAAPPRTDSGPTGDAAGQARLGAPKRIVAVIRGVPPSLAAAPRWPDDHPPGYQTRRSLARRHPSHYRRPTASGPSGAGLGSRDPSRARLGLRGSNRAPGCPHRPGALDRTLHRCGLDVQ